MQKQRLNLNKEFFFKLGLSFLSTLFLLCAIIFPNGSSYLGRTVGQYLLPLANSIGINSTWNFFSPDPANTMYFVYHIYFEGQSGEDTKEPIEGFIPPEKNKIVTDASRRRMLYAMRYLMLDERRLQVFLAPWLCKDHPGASRVSVYSVIEKIPTLDEVTINKSLSIDEMKQEAKSNSVSFKCHELQDEISL